MTSLSILKQDFLQVGKRERLVIATILVSAFGLGTVAVFQLGTLSLSSGTAPAAYSPPKAAKPQQSTGTAPITLITNQNTVSVGDTFTVTMTIDSGNQSIEAAEFAINFDPAILAVENIQTGTFFKTYPRNETGEGVINISGVAEFTNNTFVIPKGQGTVAIITFQTQKQGSTKIALDKEKTIVASGGKNVVGKMEDVNIQVQ